jgi:hypothetical protein
MSRKFRVDFVGSVEIELEDAVIDAVNDDWRKVFYDIHTPEDIAGMIAYNIAINRAKLSHLDGWADQPDSNVKVISSPEFEIDDVEELK